MPRPKDFPAHLVAGITASFDAAMRPPFSCPPWRDRMLEVSFATAWIVHHLYVEGRSRADSARAVRDFTKQARRLVSEDPWPIAEAVLTAQGSMVAVRLAAPAEPRDCRTCAHTGVETSCGYSGLERDAVDGWIDAQAWTEDLALVPRADAWPCPGHQSRSTP